MRNASCIGKGNNEGCRITGKGVIGARVMEEKMRRQYKTAAARKRMKEWR